MDTKLLFLYFVLGGSVVALATYFGGQGKGLLAAFVGIFPSITVLTFCTIYLHGGAGAAASYSRGLLAMWPAWLAYVLSIYFLIPRWGFVPALILGVFLYAGIALTIVRFIR